MLPTGPGYLWIGAAISTRPVTDDDHTEPTRDSPTHVVHTGGGLVYTASGGTKPGLGRTTVTPLVNRVIVVACE